MKNSRGNSLFFILLLLLFSAESFSQPLQFRFQHFTSENGLPQNTVYDVCQDKYGFMWFSTKNGICRYDGYNTKVFRPTEHFLQDVVDLSQCIETNADGNIVFGTSHGFYYIDIETDSITKHVVNKEADSTDTYINNIFSICIEGTVTWAGTGNGLIRYDQKTDDFRFFKSKELYPKLKASRLWVKGIIYDGKEFVWLATPEALIRMNTRTFKTEAFNALAGPPYFVNNNYFSSLAFDKKGRLWAGTLRKGVYCFDFANNKIDSINYTGYTDSTEAFNETKRLICDNNGFIWAATQYTGLIRIHPNTGKFQHIRANQLSAYALASDLVSALYEDRSGILWVGTYNAGVDRTSVTGSQFVNIPYSSTDSSCFSIKAVECFAEQGDSLLWVGAMKGLFLFDKVSHSCRTFEEVTGNKIPLPHLSIAGLEVDGNILWIGTRSDILLRVNLSDMTFKTYQPDTSKPLLKRSVDFRTMTKREDGKLFLSFSTRVYYYDEISDSLRVIIDRDSLLLKADRINRLSADNRYLFISSESAGLLRYEFATNTVNRVESPDMNLDKVTQNAIVRQFSDGRYVISDYKGFYLLDTAMNITSFYSMKDGLSDNKITNMHIDSKGKLWMATFNGLSSFHPGTKMFVNYYIQDGLMENEFREAKSLQGADGTLYYPINKGFTFFHPDKLLYALKDVSVFFTGFKIFDKEKKFEKNINNLSEIYIPPGFNFFTISFSSTSYNTLQPSVFAYKLEGVDRDWIVSNGSNSANYTNIDGGDYIFRVKVNPNGSDERTLNIHVGTVFYKTVWFRLLIFVLLATVVYYFIRFREKQMMKKESIKTIDYFAHSFYGRNSVEEILWDVCRNCISRLGFEDAVIYLVDEDRNVLVQKAAFGPKNPKDFEIVHPLEISIGEGIVGSVAKTGKAEIVNDTTKDNRYIADDDMRMSEIAIPLIYKDKVIGVIDSENSRKGFFNKEHLRILTTISSICSTKIAKAQSDLAAADRERRLLEIGKKVAETRLMALRAQMNPHFIFNSLNSIQECIVNENIEEASKYLSRFSKLLRMVIDYSEKNLIPLAKEIEFLNLYLGLESLRFGKSFTYSIYIDPDLDEDDALIPSLLIQPFVENAIWHGLLHKQGTRRLEISFINRNNNELLCIVEDNGIGRARASEIKAGKIDAQNHESKGMKISQERIDLVKMQTNLDPAITVEDLVDPEGIGCGTRVSVILPLEMD